MGKQAPTTRPRRQPAAQPTGRRRQAGRRVHLVGIVVASIAVLAVVAVVVTGRNGGDGSDTGLAQTRPVQVTGGPLPTHTEGAQDPAVGMAAPVLRGASFDGTPVTIGGDGKVTLVVFVAHWCPHCQRELPMLARWLEDGRLPPSVSLSVVSTAASRERPNWPPSAWLRDAGLNVPVLADDEQSSAATAYGLSAFPFFVAADADGKVVVRHSGELTPAQLDQLAAQLAAGR